jgi:FtsZ-binding cell division protein ZapB
MARTGITQEEVFQAAEAIRGEAETPSIDRVRQRLGNTGSPNTIHKYLKIWKASLPPVRQEVQELDADLAAAVAANIEKKSAAARSVAEKEAIEANRQLDLLADSNELLEVEVEAVREKNEALEAAQTAAAAEANVLKGQVEKLEAQCGADQSAAESARLETAEARYTVTAQGHTLTKLEGDLKDALGKLDAERKSAAEALKLESDKAATAVREAAVAAAQVTAETRRADQAEKRETETVAGLQGQIVELKKEITGVREEVKAAQTAMASDADEWRKTVILWREHSAELQSERDALADRVGVPEAQKEGNKNG